MDKNQSFIIANSFCLLELLLVKGSQGELNDFLTETNQKTNPLQPIIKELASPFPELKETVSVEKPAAPEVDLIGTTATLLSKTWGMTTAGFFNLANLAASATTSAPEKTETTTLQG